MTNMAVVTNAVRLGSFAAAAPGAGNATPTARAVQRAAGKNWAFRKAPVLRSTARSRCAGAPALLPLPSRGAPSAAAAEAATVRSGGTRRNVERRSPAAAAPRRQCVVPLHVGAVSLCIGIDPGTLSADSAIRDQAAIAILDRKACI
jgi:hypothetical protein